MSTPGWYPDPDGTPRRFRFWDGAHWSQQTSADPRNPAPPRSPADSPDGRRRTSDRGWAIALIVLLAVTLIAVAAFVVFGLRSPFGGGTAVPDDNGATPTVTGWDETSPSTPPPNQSGGSQVPCPFATHTSNTRQVSGKLTADTLQVDRIPGWPDQAVFVPFSFDSHWQYTNIYPGWMSNIGVGLLANSDGFTDTATSANQVMECLATSGYYADFTYRVDLINEETTVNGYPAWHIQSQIHVSMPALPQVQGDIVDVIVVVLGGTRNYLGLYLSCYTIGDTAVQKQVETAMATLTVTG